MSDRDTVCAGAQVPYASFLDQVYVWSDLICAQDACQPPAGAMTHKFYS